MAEQEPHSLASTFPNPPAFWTEFTADKVTKYDKLRQEYADKNGLNTESSDGPSFRIPDLPEDLQHKQPPPEPADGRWRVFGDQYMLDDKLPTLEDQGITNLPASTGSNARDAKHHDRAFELKRLAKSLLLNFLELSGTLSGSPADAEAKVQDLRTIFINMHHILNEYRPHQARESAIKMMEDHLDRTRAETVAIRTQVDKAKRVLEGLGSIGVPADTTASQKLKPSQGNEAAEKNAALDRDADTWAVVDNLFT